MLPFVPFTPWIIFATSFAVGVTIAGLSVPSAPRVGIWTGGLTGGGMALFYGALVFRTQAELLGLALLFVPVMAIRDFFVSVLVAWALAILLTASRQDVERRIAIGACVLVAMAMAGSAVYCVREFRVQRVERTDAPRELGAFFRSWRSDDSVLLGAFARNRATPADVLAQIAAESGRPLPGRRSLRGLVHYDPQPVMQRVAEHPNTPPLALARLARDRDPQVASAAAENPRTPAAPPQ